MLGVSPSEVEPYLLATQHPQQDVSIMAFLGPLIYGHMNSHPQESGEAVLFGVWCWDVPGGYLRWSSE